MTRGKLFVSMFNKHTLLKDKEYNDLGFLYFILLFYVSSNVNKHYYFNAHHNDSRQALFLRWILFSMVCYSCTKARSVGLSIAWLNMLTVFVATTI